jgi:hypothetical protein
MNSKAVYMSDDLLMQALKDDNDVEFGKWLGRESDMVALHVLLDRTVHYKSLKTDYESPVNGKDLNGVSNTVLCGIYVLKAYKCFSKLAKIYGSHMDFELLHRKMILVKPLEGMAMNIMDARPRHKVFVDAFAEGRNCKDILPWLVVAKEYWTGFLQRFGLGDGTEYRVSAGVVNLLSSTTVENSELVIALYRAKIISFADVLIIIETSKDNGCAGKIDKKTMLYVEHEELLRMNSEKTKSASVAL